MSNIPMTSAELFTILGDDFLDKSAPIDDQAGADVADPVAQFVRKARGEEVPQINVEIKTPVIHHEPDLDDAEGLSADQLFKAIRSDMGADYLYPGHKAAAPVSTLTDVQLREVIEKLADKFPDVDTLLGKLKAFAVRNGKAGVAAMVEKMIAVQKEAA